MMACNRLHIMTWQSLSWARNDCFEGSHIGFNAYKSGFLFSGKSCLFGQGCNVRTKGVSSLVENLGASRFSGRIAFALDTGGLPSNNDQENNVNSFTSGLGGTRLGRIVDAGARQLLQKLNAARKNFPMKVFLLLLGFYTANALATILGQTGDWDVLVAGVVVAAIEGIGMLMYRKPLPVTSEKLQSLVMMVNYWKAGVCLGLFVDAFKLGS